MALHGTIPDFPLETVLQLLAATARTGRLVVRSGREEGELGVSRGKLTSARWEGEGGELALGAAFAVGQGEFEFVASSEAPAANLSGELDDLLDRAVTVRDRLVALRALLPGENAAFRLSERAAERREVTITSDQWRALLAVDGRRDVPAIAARLDIGRLPATILVAELVEAGLVDPVEGPGEPERGPVRWSPPPVPPAPPPAAPAPEKPLAETPLDRPPEPDQRLAALSGVFGTPEPAPPPPAWESPPAAPPPAAPMAPPPPAPAEIPPPERKGLFGMFAPKGPGPLPVAGARAAELGTFANDLAAEYNSGRYGKARIAEPMSAVLMRVDEQAEPIDRRIPLAGEGIDVSALGADGGREAQAVPYLAALIREIYEEAERAFGRDKAKRGYKEVRSRLFGKEPAALQAPEIAARLPRV